MIALMFAQDKGRMMSKKVLLIRGGALKKRVVGRAFNALMPDTACEIIELENELPDTDQIISKEECLGKMRQAISKFRLLYPDCHYFVFMRGRFDDDGSKMEECALVMIQDQAGNEGVSQAASFEVPERVAELVRNGESFSSAVEKVYSIEGVREGSGFVGILTKGLVVKEEQYFQATAIALASCLARY